MTNKSWFLYIIESIKSYTIKELSDDNNGIKHVSVNDDINEYEYTNKDMNEYINEYRKPRKSPSFPINPPFDEESSNENETCKICLTNKIKTINLNCRHLVFCFECSKDFVLKNIQHKCPICRELITKIKML